MDKVTEKEFDVAVGKLGETYSSAMLRGDVDLCMTVWDDDAIQMPPNSPMVIGRDAIRSAFAHTFRLLRYTEFRVTPHEIRHGDEIGYLCVNYTYAFRRTDRGAEEKREGKSLGIICRQPDGSWKLHIDCFNLNAPPA